MNIKSILLTIHLLIAYFAIGQAPTADFSANTKDFCETGTVSFTDLSNDNGKAITSRTWTFGNGNNSVLENPDANYISTGTYTVSLEVCNADGCNTETKTDYIKVFQNPEASFTTDNTLGCIPHDITFTSTSSGTDGAIVSYLWGFGDGRTSTEENPTHNYTTLGTRIPSLTVTDENECQASYPSGDDEITINSRESVSTNFMADDSNSCINPFEVTFTELGTYSDAATFNWDFGDGTNDSTNDRNISHTYTTEGKFDVSLTISTSGNNCEASFSKSEYINLLIDDISIVSDDIVCPNATTTYSINSEWPDIQGYWTFNDIDNTTRTGTSTSFAYSSSNVGNNTIDLVVENTLTGCSTTTNKVVEVQNVIADFNLNTSIGCSFPHTSNLTNNSVGGNNFTWTATQTDPDFEAYTATSNEEIPNLVIEEEGLFTITLLVTSDEGCSDRAEITEGLEVKEPEGILEREFSNQVENVSVMDDIYLRPPEMPGGCLPLDIEFWPEDIDFSPGSNTIDRVEWTFSDGSLDTTFDDGRNLHTILTEGTHITEAIVYNTDGCPLVIRDTARAANPPELILDHTFDNLCDSIDLDDYFTNTSIGAEYFEWEFTNESNPFSQVTVNDSQVHILNNDTGYYDLTFTVEKYNCRVDTFIERAVRILGPVIKVGGGSSCGVPSDLRYYDSNISGSSVAIDNYLWTFSDGSTSTEEDPYYGVTVPGNYQATLRGSNDETGCSYSRTGTAGAKNLVPDIKVDQARGCHNHSPTWTALNLNDEVDSLSIEIYEQYDSNIFFTNPDLTDYPFGTNYVGSDDSTVSVALPIQTGDSSNNYYGARVRYYNSELRCEAEVYVDSLVRIMTGEANFGIDTLDGCTDFLVSTSDSSTADTAISLYIWNWRDGAIDTTYPNSPDTNHTYTVAGTYRPTLTLVDAYGCTDAHTFTSTIEPTFPVPNISFENDTLCFNRQLRFDHNGTIAIPNSSRNTILDSAIYVWNFGDGNTDSVLFTDNVAHTYAAGGNYTVSLRTYDRNGCTADTSIDLIIQEPNAYLYTDDPRTKICPSMAVTYNADSSSKDIVRLYWAFGDGNDGLFDTTEQFTAFNLYTRAGDFDIQLVGETSIGCVDTFIRESYIEIDGPEAVISIDTLEGCRGMTVEFLLNDMKDVTTYFWDFGDGVIDSSEINPTYYTYEASGSYIPSVQLWDGQDPVCTYKLDYDGTIFVHDIEANFSIPSYEDCRPFDLTVSDLSVLDENSYGSISPAIMNWYWNFDTDTLFSSESLDSNQNSSFTYADTGRYTIQLIVEDPIGCRDTLTFNDSISVIGSYANFNVDTMKGCSPLSITFSDASDYNNSSESQWDWDFGDGNVDNIKNPTNTYVLDSVDALDTFTIKLVVVDDQGCTDSITLQDTISTTFPRVSFSLNDSAICLGDSIDLINSSYGIGLHHLWSYGQGNAPITIDSIIDSVENKRYQFDTDGIFGIQLIVSDTNNCSDTVTALDILDVQNPIASFTNDYTYKYCPDTSFQLIDSSYRTDIITTWKWYIDEMDSIILTDTNNGNITYNFDSAKLYDIRLQVISSAGCIDDTIKNNIVEIEGPYAVIPEHDTIGCEHTLVNFSISDSNNIDQFRWIFGDGDTSDWTSSGAVSHSYVSGGKFIPSLLLSDGIACADTAGGLDTIDIENIDAHFTVLRDKACLYDTFAFNDSSTFAHADGNSFSWDYGDSSANSVDTNTTHRYLSSDSFTVRLVITSGSILACTDTSEMIITVDSIPVIAVMPNDTICIGDSIELTSSGQGTISWSPANSLNNDSINSPIASPLNSTTYSYLLVDGNACKNDTSVYIEVTGIDSAGFARIQTDFSPLLKACVPFTFDYDGSSVGNVNEWEWLFEDDTITSSTISNTYNSAGNYQIYLVLNTGLNSICQDTIVKNIIADSVPIIRSITGDTILCIDSSIELSVNDQIGTVIWSTVPFTDDNNIDTTLSQNPNILNNPPEGRYYAMLYNSEGCTDTSSVFINIYDPGSGTVDILPRGENEDEILVAEGTNVKLYSDITYDDIIGLEYEWIPSDWLICENCGDTSAHLSKHPLFRGEVRMGEDSSYFNVRLIVRDSYNCLIDEDELLIKVAHRFSQVVPDAFSPNGDGTNDELFVRGWGIEELLEFRIYNRWGEVVFETTDIDEGWDGTYKGEPVPIGTYVYTLKARSIRGVETNLIKGDFLIVR